MVEDGKLDTSISNFLCYEKFVTYWHPHIVIIFIGEVKMDIICRICKKEWNNINDIRILVNHIKKE